MDDTRASQSQPEPPKITQSLQKPTRVSQNHPEPTRASQFFLFIHILTENLQSPSTIFFSMPGNQPAKICFKVN